MLQSWKKAPYLEKFTTLGKLRHASKNVPHLKNWATLAKNAAELVKCGNLGKFRHT